MVDGGGVGVSVAPAPRGLRVSYRIACSFSIDGVEVYGQDLTVFPIYRFRGFMPLRGESANSERLELAASRLDFLCFN